MSAFIPHLHDDLRRARLTRRGTTKAPLDAPRGQHKSYARMDRIVLPEPGTLSTSLTDALSKRASAQKAARSPLSSEDFGSLLGHALKKKSDLRRRYPSGGALFPVETYLLREVRTDSMPDGVFHYNPTEHSLERLWDLPLQINFDELITHTPKDFGFSELLVFTSVWERSSAKYGDYSYILSLLEAGHMSENVLLVAEALGISARPMAGFDDSHITAALDIDAELEQPIHAITLGRSGTKDANDGAAFYE